MDKVSVITVVYNDEKHIKSTLDSFFAQTWPEKELIVVDGGSTDGTTEIIRDYANRISWWCSERDNGIYDAMNKGIMRCSGQWIGFLNSGDYYADSNSLERFMSTVIDSQVAVIYGHSMEFNGSNLKLMLSMPPSGLNMGPTFRHGSCLIRSDVQKKHLFDLALSKTLHYALDWQMLYTLFLEGHRFCQVDAVLEIYQKDGVSNHPYRNLWYNYKITSNGLISISKFNFFVKSIVRTWIKQTILYRYLGAYLRDYAVNNVLTHIPFWSFRRFYLRKIGIHIGEESFIMKQNYIIQCHHLSIGKGSHINRDCTIDARGGISIGNSVCISHRVNLITGSHDVQSSVFMGKFSPIVIDDYVFLGIGCTVLPGVHIGRGAVVSAGAVVTKDVVPFSIVGGIPAKEIGSRNEDLDYICQGWQPLT